MVSLNAGSNAVRLISNTSCGVRVVSVLLELPVPNKVLLANPEANNSRNAFSVSPESNNLVGSPIHKKLTGIGISLSGYLVFSLVFLVIDASIAPLSYRHKPRILRL